MVRGVTTSTIQPGLAPSDYHLFGLLKKMLGGDKFASGMELLWAVRQWLVQQPTSFFLHRAFTNLLKDGTM